MSAWRRRVDSEAAGTYHRAMDVVVAITGASGALYAQRCIRGLAAAGVRVHLIVSPLGRRLLCDELGYREIDLGVLSDGHADQVVLYNYADVGSRLASGGFVHQGMVVIPCSSNTLGQIAGGLGDNLIARAAAVALKERRRLVLVHREMPLSLVDINHYQLLTQAGAVIAPACPGWYHRPQTVTELADFVAGKVLDLFGVAHDLVPRWEP